MVMVWTIGQCRALPLSYLTDIYQDRYPTAGFTTRSASRSIPSNCLSLVSRAGSGWPSLNMEADNSDIRNSFLHGLSHVLAQSDVAIETVDANGTPAVPPADVLAAAATARPARLPLTNDPSASSLSPSSSSQINGTPRSGNSRRGSDNDSNYSYSGSNIDSDGNGSNGNDAKSDAQLPLISGEWEISVQCRNLVTPNANGHTNEPLSPLVALNDGSNGKLIGNTEFKR
jgi:hypothetical protein